LHRQLTHPVAALLRHPCQEGMFFNHILSTIFIFYLTNVLPCCIFVPVFANTLITQTKHNNSPGLKSLVCRFTATSTPFIRESYHEKMNEITYNAYYDSGLMV
jgi:hypothetical protein